MHGILSVPPPAEACARSRADPAAVRQRTSLGPATPYAGREGRIACRKPAGAVSRRRIAPMIARSFPLLSSLALLAGLSGPLLSAPAQARDGGVTPAEVLAAKTARRSVKSTAGKAAGDRSFAERIARVGAIMGSDLGKAPRLSIPERPDWTRPRYREADALSATR